MNNAKNDPDVIRWRKLIEQPDIVPEIINQVYTMPKQTVLIRKPKSGFRNNSLRNQSQQQRSCMQLETFTIDEELIEKVQAKDGLRMAANSNKRRMHDVRSRYEAMQHIRLEGRLDVVRQLEQYEKIGIYAKKEKVNDKIRKIHQEVESIMGKF